ncbi:MAG TPA: hypothetical protein VE465_09215 [Streptosporangiaceae bacterium]|nr:hypothetical protein [Streptosporangiaceae bacterium]
MPNPQQPELRRAERGGTADDAAKQIPEKTRLKGRPPGTDKGTKGGGAGPRKKPPGQSPPHPD